MDTFAALDEIAALEREIERLEAAKAHCRLGPEWQDIAYRIWILRLAVGRAQRQCERAGAFNAARSG